ncbi:MAG: thiamine pyrophosphate-binding protein [Candidatus Hodarchaeota archaeon]
MTKKLSISGGSLVAKSLVQEDVKYVFSISGGHINPIYRGLVEEGIEIITTRHEQAAGNAAEGWAKITRTPGICLVTAGPGFANIIPALISAYYSKSPIVAITGHTPLKHIDLYASQELDQIPLITPVTKYAKMVYDTARIPQYIQEAFRAATAENMGPALVDIPQDIQTLHWEIDDENRYFNLPPSKYRTQGKTYPDPLLVKEAAKLLVEAQNPIIIAGSGVYWGNAAEEIFSLTEFMSIPLAYFDLGKGCIPDLHPLSIGNASQNPILCRADVILAIGVTFEELLGFGTNPMFYDPDVKVINVDPDPTHLGKNRPLSLGVVSSIAPFLKELIFTLKKITQVRNMHLNWANTAKKDRNELESLIIGHVTESHEVPIKPQRLTKELQSFLDHDTRLILDGGDTTVWAQLILKADYPGQIIGSQGHLGHLGAGLPMGIAAKLAEPEKNIIVLTGDGSFLFNGAEIDTAIRYDLPLVIIIENDSQWGMIAHNQDLSWGERIGTTLDEKGHIDYVKFAESLGGQGELVTRPEDITNAVKKARDSGTVSLVDVRIDPFETNILNQLAAAKSDPDYWK